MSGILFLAHRVPFPPDRGDKIRSHHILQALAELAPVHVGCLADNAQDRAQERELAAVATTFCIAGRSKPLPVAGLEALWRGRAVSQTAFHSPALAQWVDMTLQEQAIEAIYVFSGQMGQYVPADWRGRLIVDLVDVDSAKFEAYGRTKPWPKSLIDRREGRLLKAEEARLAARADETLLVSEAEAELLLSRLPRNSTARVRALGNGIDANYFDPAAVAGHPALAGSPGPHIVFTGQMDYAPNVAAACRVIERLLPPLRQSHPQTEFHVVGRNPAARLLASNGSNGCRVWGAVPDVRPFLAAADLVLAPLEIARGVQNKVLEAMAMARPVLLTTEAAAGIPATAGEHFVVADDDEALVGEARRLLDDPARAQAIGRAARQFVIEQMSWPAMLSGLPDLLGLGSEAGGRRDAA